MKIRTWIKYEESYLPPRCRKLRYRECEEYVDIELQEVEMNQLKLAFEDKSYGGAGKIYAYNSKLWAKKKVQTTGNYRTALEYLIYCNENCSKYFRFDHHRITWKMDTSKEAVIEAAESDMAEYILVDGELYTETGEPRYVVMTFGLGHNHGGTGMLSSYFYNDNISKNNYFSALEGEKAVSYANEVAMRRGDTDDVGKFKPFIVCHMPELVTVNPDKQHGNGNEFLNDVENMIQNTNDSTEAGLLAVGILAAELKK